MLFGAWVPGRETGEWMGWQSYWKGARSWNKNLVLGISLYFFWCGTFLQSPSPGNTMDYKGDWCSIIQLIIYWDIPLTILYVAIVSAWSLLLFAETKLPLIRVSSKFQCLSLLIILKLSSWCLLIQLFKEQPWNVQIMK